MDSVTDKVAEKCSSCQLLFLCLIRMFLNFIILSLFVFSETIIIFVSLLNEVMDKNILEFVTFCVGAIAFDLKLPRNVVYGKLKCSGILDGYIVPSYDVLHTFSRPYIVSDLTEFMKEKGVLA